jgi:hypothetical protein
MYSINPITFPIVGKYYHQFTALILFFVGKVKNDELVKTVFPPKAAKAQRKYSLVNSAFSVTLW